MEHEQNFDVFENDIALYLSMFCEEQRIDDMTKEPQSRWNAALMYIKRYVFNDKSVLKSKKNISVENNNISSNFNAYNYDAVSSVADIYIYLCAVYDKEVSLNGFSYLTGINTDTLIDWGHSSTRLSNSSCEIYKKLTKANEESLESKLATGNKNPVGIIAILNRRHGWASPYTSDSSKQRTVLTASELPRLDAELRENQAQIEAITSTE